MEASLPASAAFNPATARSAVPKAPAAIAPSVTLPLRFMLTGVIALLVGAAWLVAQPVMLATYHYNQNVIAVTHLFLLGWICSVVMGAMYQLVPVALETKLYSERLAKWQFVFHVVGFVGMVWMFRIWNMKQVGHFGSVMVFSVGLFVYNLVRTLARAPKWNVAAWAIAAALGWISVTVVAGLSLAAAKCDYTSALTSSSAPVALLLQGCRSIAAFVARFDQIGAMHAHAHLGVLGFFVMLIVGISYKLVPMFTLSEIQSQRRAACSILLLNVGLAGSVI
jgi:cbb3-type cytochrome oxidase subunit 1